MSSQFNTAFSEEFTIHEDIKVEAQVPETDKSLLDETRVSELITAFSHEMTLHENTEEDLKCKDPNMWLKPVAAWRDDSLMACSALDEQTIKFVSVP